ncbi:chaperonin 10-like protein [Biscogniauxia mediterranea]|nr:chaperonin 10-like protein [Biscogniauxia mediterranea]
MLSNTAAYLSAVREPLAPREAPYLQPGPNEVVIRNHAIALNPLPIILGSDVAGEVVAVGSEATSRFSVGDRIVGLVDQGFQEHPTVKTHLASHLPSHVSYEQASALPLALITASVGLFGKGYLELQHPSVKPKPTGKSLLIWGGATSVGSCAIQAAVSAGYEVITTASPKNFEYVKKLGASYVFDFRSPTVQDDIISLGLMLKAKQSVTNACLDVASKVDGVKFISMAMSAPDKLTGGVDAKFIIAFDIKTDLELGNVIFRDYLPNALSSGKFTPAPPAEVIGEGLKALQEGLDTLQKGVSAKKLVVTM